MDSIPRRLIPFCLLALLLVGVPHGHAEPRTGFRLEARVPASTLAFLGVEEVGTWEERFESTAIGKLLAEPEMKAFAEPMAKDLEAMLENPQDGPLADVPPLALELLQQLAGVRGQLAVALLDVDLAAERPRLVATLDFGDRLADFVTFLTRLNAELGEDGGAIETFERQGRTWWRLDTGGGPVITATTVDTAFVIATDPEALSGVLEGPRPDALASTSAFRACRARAGGDALGLFLYANVPHVVRRFGEEMPPDVRQVANALGLDTVEGAAYGMAFAGDGFLDTLTIHTPGADHGLAALDLLRPMRPQALPFVPSSAIYYSESAMALSDLVPRVRALVEHVDPDAVAEMDEALENVGHSIGVDLESELLPALGDRAAVYAGLPETGGLFPEVALMLRVRDETSFEPLFQRVAQGVAGLVTEQGDVIASPRTIEYHGRRLHLVELQAAQGSEVVPFTPTWALHDGWLVMTAVPYTMKEILLRAEERRATGASGGLATQEDFAAVMRHMPAEAGAIEYLDTQAMLSFLYDTGVPLLQTVAKPNVLPVPVRVDWAQLPPARSVRKHFRSFASFTTWTRDGLQVAMHGPVPVLAIAVVGIGVLAQAGGAREMDALEMATRTAPAVAQTDMVRMQGQEVMRFVRLFELEKGRLPASLQELVDDDVMPQVQRDPWGRPFELVIFEPAPGETGVRIVSAGPDGAMDTSDDVVVSSD